MKDGKRMRARDRRRILALPMSAVWFLITGGCAPGGQDPEGAIRYAESPDGSAVPCDVPLRWRIAEVDPRFGLSPDDVHGIVEEATGLWEQAVFRSLFRHDPIEGFPVRFVFDERQSETLERAGVRAAVAREEAELERRRSILQALNDRWTRERGRPDLDPREAERLREELQRRAEAFNRDVEDFNLRQGEVSQRFQPLTTESGVFRERVRTRNDRVLSVDRELVIYQFTDRTHLLFLLAHELGHALGLGHSDLPGAIMAPVADRMDEGERVVAVGAPDLELLRARCPAI